MKYTELEDYLNEKISQGLVKIDLNLALDDTLGQDLYVIKTKETYEFFEEADADAMINKVRCSQEFAGVEKKFKQGKVNKAGEIIRDDAWYVVAKLLK